MSTSSPVLADTDRIALVVRLGRQQAGLSLDTLARLSRLSADSVLSLERGGRDPQRGELLQVLDVLAEWL